MVCVGRCWREGLRGPASGRLGILLCASLLLQRALNNAIIIIYKYITYNIVHIIYIYMNVCERREDRVSREYYGLASIFIADVHLQLRYIRVSYYQYVVPFDVIYYCHYRYLYPLCIIREVCSCTDQKGVFRPWSGYRSIYAYARHTYNCEFQRFFQPPSLFIPFLSWICFLGFDNNVPTRRKGAFKMWRTARDLRFFLPRVVYLLKYILYNRKIISPGDTVSVGKSLNLVVLASYRI